MREILRVAAACGVKRIVFQSSQAVVTRPESPSHAPLHGIEDLVRRAGLTAAVAGGLGGVLVAGWAGLVALVVAALSFIGARRMMLRRLGGCTGDTAGALLELLEMAVLVGWALS